MKSFYIIIFSCLGFILGYMLEEYRWFQKNNPGMGFKEYLIWKGWF